MSSGYAEVNGIRLYLEIFGQGRPLVLLHGGLMTIGEMSTLLEPLAKTHQVIAVELQGHGRVDDRRRCRSRQRSLAAHHDGDRTTRASATADDPPVCIVPRQCGVGRRFCMRDGSHPQLSPANGQGVSDGCCAGCGAGRSGSHSRGVDMSTRHEIAGELRVTTIFPGYTATNFASRVRKEDLRAQPEKSGEAFAMPPEAVAAAIAHAIDQPDGVNVAEIVMRSTGQP